MVILMKENSKESGNDELDLHIWWSLHILRGYLQKYILHIFLLVR